MDNKVLKKEGSVFELDGRPSMKQALPLALQHVVAMVLGCVTPAIIVAGVAMSKGEITADDQIILVQSALLVAGIATLIQLFPLRNWMGSRLPMIMGVSFSYLASLQAIAMEYSIAAIFGAQLIGGMMAVIVGIFITKLQKLFPPLVSGTVVLTIGLSLYPTAINYMAGGAGKESYGSWQNWVVALITLGIVTYLNHFAKGFLKLASILVGILAGYAIALCFQMVDIQPVIEAGWFQIARPLHFGIEFDPPAIASIGILFIVNSVQAIGDLSATTQGGLDREPTTAELRGGIIGSGIGSMIGAFISGLPVATFSQNVGIVGTTKVVNRMVLGLAAVIIIVAALIPKFASLLTTIPSCVLGGATVSVFASITMTGIKLISKDKLTSRNCSIVGLAVAMGVGVTLVPESLAMFPAWVTMVFGKSAVVISTIVTVFLNQLLPKDQDTA